MEAAALTVRPRCLAAAAAAARPARGAHRGAAASATAPRSGARRRHGRLRALPPELSEILAPKLVPGSPADTGDVSSLIPISAVMLLFYLVSNWVFPAVIMKGMKPNAEDEAAAAAAVASMSSPPAGQRGDAVDGKIRAKVKKKKKKSRKAAATEV